MLGNKNEHWWQTRNREECGESLKSGCGRWKIEAQNGSRRGLLQKWVLRTPKAQSQCALEAGRPTGILGKERPGESSHPGSAPSAWEPRHLPPGRRHEGRDLN